MCYTLRLTTVEWHGKKLKRDKARQFAYRLAMIAGRLDVDAMLEELSPDQMAEWEAMLDFIGIDKQQQQSARLCRELHVIAEKFAGHDSDASLEAALRRLPSMRDFMGLYTFDRKPAAIPFEVQTQEQISKTLLRL